MWRPRGDVGVLYILSTPCLSLSFEFIGVLRHIQRYFSDTCDGKDVQADWKRSCTYGRAPNAIDISQGSLSARPTPTQDHPFLLYSDSDTPPHLVAFFDTLGIWRTYSRLTAPASLGEGGGLLVVRSDSMGRPVCRGLRPVSHEERILVAEGSGDRRLKCLPDPTLHFGLPLF